jgi:uncharacterized lipoprotein YajG
MKLSFLVLCLMALGFLAGCTSPQPEDAPTPPKGASKMNATDAGSAPAQVNAPAKPAGAPQ